MKYTEEEIEFDTGYLKLRGKLSIPETETAPFVVFVHGSGPQDRDGTVGPNKIWKDLAEGLAKNGIGSLRFDKKSYAYDIRESTNSIISDVYHAIDFLDDYTDQVYVIGQSLGGMLAPKIAKGKDVDGIVMMAAPARHLDEVGLDQQEHKAKVENRYDNKMRENFENSRKKIQERIKKRKSHPTDSIQDLDIPILVIGGSKDCQVFEKDYKIWNDILEEGGKDYESYWLDVNHMMMPCESADMSEYYKENSVDEQVIETISKWIKQKSRN